MPSETWNRFRALSLALPDLPILLDLSRSCLDADAFASDPLVAGSFPGALREMEALEKGAVANPDEGRRVGHYWLRAPHLAPEPAIRWEIEEALARVKRFAAEVHAGRVAPPGGGRFENLLVIGIGGSALGPQLVADALTSEGDRMRPFFFDNTDPDGMARELSRIGGAPGLGKTLAVVVSKSGGTKETRNGMLEAAAAYRAAGLSFPAHAIAITQDGSELDLLARKDGWRERFPMWDWVGGRTSVLSAVGLLPAALQGIDVDEMLAGAAACDAATRASDVARNPAALLALAWYRETAGRGAKDMVVLPYKDRLLLLSRYLQQLVMESLGKERDLAGRVVHQGISVYGNKGSTDQHAYVQQLREGVPNFFVTFVEVLRDRVDGRASLEVEPGVTSGDFLHGFLLGTRDALAEKGRSSITLTIDGVSPRSIGVLIALFERTVGLYASLVGINAYHQPGVEAGKKAAGKVLALQGRIVEVLKKAPGSFRPATEIAAALGEGTSVETVFRVLEHLAANPARGVVRRPGATAFEALYGAG